MITYLWKKHSYTHSKGNFLQQSDESNGNSTDLLTDLSSPPGLASLHRRMHLYATNSRRQLLQYNLKTVTHSLAGEFSSRMVEDLEYPYF